MAGAAAAATQPVCADTAVADAAQPDSFDAAFFAPYSPNNAMDVLGHVPGFSIEDGGGAGANVLIDGQRPARSQQLNTLLSHIPASQVLRVEILRGARAAAAAPGRSTVANIIRSASAGDGLWSAGVEYAGGNLSPRGSASWNGRQGAVEYGLGVTYEDHDRPQRSESVTTDSTGAVTSSERESGERAQRRRGLTATSSALLGDGGRLSLNAEARESSDRQNAAGESFDADGAALGDSDEASGENERDYELGASFEHDIGRWAGTIDGVLNRVEAQSLETKARVQTDGDYDERHANDRVADGALVRGTLSQQLNETQRLEIGVEHGDDTVEAQRNTMYAGPGWSSDQSGDVHVEQEHAKAYATHLWKVAPHWSVETHLAREMTRLAFSDEIAQSNRSSYWTGSVQVTRELGRRSQVRARILRDAGHVEPDGLIEALADNATPDGIPDIHPDMTWRAEVNTDLRFGRGGSLGVTLSHAWIEDALDTIMVSGPNGAFAAPGNLGEAQIDALNVNIWTPVKLVPGATFSMSGGVANSEVLDPLTGESRSLRSIADARVWMEFRQDVPAHEFSWGVSYSQQTPSFWLGRDNIGSWQGGPSVDAFLETTAIDGVKARFRASSVLDAPARVEQIYYTPVRGGALDHVEESENYSGTTLSVSVAGTF